MELPTVNDVTNVTTRNFTSTNAIASNNNYSLNTQSIYLESLNKKNKKKSLASFLVLFSEKLGFLNALLGVGYFPIIIRTLLANKLFK